MAWTTYKGVNVPDVTSSGAGTFLADDVRTLADRVVYTAAADPTATNDTTQGFAPGSEWLNTNTLQTWECISAATGAAVWSQVIQVASGSVNFNSDVGIGEASPTALLHLKSGTASAGTAPVKLTSGTLLTTPEAGAIEYDGTNFFATPSSAVREKLAYADGSNTTGLVIEGPGTAGQNTIQPTAASVVPLTLQQFSTSTADLTDWKNAGGTVLASVSSAGTITAPLVTGLGTPSNPADAANKQYVDATVQGLQIKPTANLATNGGLPTNTYSNGSSGVGATLTATSNGALTVDSIAVTAGMLILVKNESAAANNGLYVVTATGDASHPYVLTRSVDMDTAGQFAGAFVPVDNQGTANANTLWLANPSGTVTVGTTAIPFTQLNGATSLAPGTGISISGNTISISASYAGQSSITTLGTITTGTWNGTTIAIANGGTGATTANAALNNLLPSQTGNNGLFLTTNGSNASWAAGAGGNNWPPAVLATATVLPTNVYNNGSSGVGATLTGYFNGTLSVDGVTVSVGNLILVKNEVTAANNGLYIVTATGGSYAQYVLTRDTSMNQGNLFVDALVPVTGSGSTNAGTIWSSNITSPITVGTTAVTFVKVGATASGFVLTAPGSTAANTIAATNTSTVPLKLVLTSGSGQDLIDCIGAGGSNLVFKVSSLGLVECVQLQIANAGFGTTGTFVANGYVTFGGQTADIHIGSSGVMQIGSGSGSGIANLKLQHLIGGSSAPTIAANTGAGSGPTVSMTSGSTDLAGQISCLTGTVTPGANDVVTITFNVAFGTAPWVSLTPANAAAAALSGGAAVYLGSSTTTTFKLSVGASGLASSTTYLWNYHVIQ